MTKGDSTEIGLQKSVVIGDKSRFINNFGSFRKKKSSNTQINSILQSMDLDF